MPKIAANLTMLFTELPFLERFDAASEAGFDGVEVLFPYDDPAADILRELHATGLPLALINAPPPNYAGGPLGYAAVPGLEDRFRRDFRRVLRYARRLGAQHIHIMAGEAEGPEAQQTFLRNLGWAAAEAPGQSLTIEPLNPQDKPGYFLNDFAQAAEVIGEVGAANLGLQFDSYHAHVITGDVTGTWRDCAPLVRHVQIGDAPGRHEPGSGEIDFAGFLAALAEAGYDGWISAEYHPGGRTGDGLGWLAGMSAGH